MERDGWLVFWDIKEGRESRESISRSVLKTCNLNFVLSYYINTKRNLYFLFVLSRPLLTLGY